MLSINEKLISLTISAITDDCSLGDNQLSGAEGERLHPHQALRFQLFYSLCSVFKAVEVGSSKGLLTQSAV